MQDINLYRDGTESGGMNHIHTIQSLHSPSPILRLSQFEAEGGGEWSSVFVLCYHQHGAHLSPILLTHHQVFRGDDWDVVVHILHLNNHCPCTCLET